MKPIATNQILWHDTKTDPPKRNGQYAVVFHASLCCPWERHTYENGKWRSELGYVIKPDELYLPTMWAKIITPDGWDKI